jgi:hypothetical protein
MKCDVVFRKHPKLNIFVGADGRILVPSNTPSKAHLTKGYLNDRGYYRIGLKKKGYQVHRLVAETFLPNPKHYKTVDHINRNKLDNRVENLRWASHKMQADNRISTERSLKEYGVRCCENQKEYYKVRYQKIKDVIKDKKNAYNKQYYALNREKLLMKQKERDKRRHKNG